MLSRCYEDISGDENFDNEDEEMADLVGEEC
jgi:hypothetical protein